MTDLELLRLFYDPMMYGCEAPREEANDPPTPSLCSTIYRPQREHQEGEVKWEP